MNETLVRSWWILALRGVAALLFGVLAVMWPAITLLVLVALFAAYALVGGTAAALGAAQQRKEADDWWIVLLLGLVSVAAGAISIFYPAVTALALVLVMGVNALIIGVLDIVIAIRLRKEIEGEWLLILAGVISIAFGAFVCIFPGAGALALIWLVAFHAIFLGTLLLALAFKVRAWAKAREPGAPGGRPAGFAA